MTPQFRLLANSRNITDRIADRLVSLSVTDEGGMRGDTLELVLDDRDFVLAWPQQGAELRCWLGYRSTGLYDMGLYVVDEVGQSGPPTQMTIRARAANQTEDSTVSALEEGLKAPKSRSWHDTTIGAIVGQIAHEHGYDPRVSPSLASVAITHADQTAESDLHFLTRLAERLGAIAKPAATHLVFVSRGTGLSASGQPLTPVAIARADLVDWDINVPGRGRYASILATYQDYGDAERKEYVAGSGQPQRELPGIYPSEVEARAAAWAALAEAQRGRAHGTLRLEGNPLLAAERIVRLTGFRAAFNAEWVVTRATHTLDGDGYRTDLEIEAPPENQEGGPEL